MSSQRKGLTTEQQQNLGLQTLVEVCPPIPIIDFYSISILSNFFARFIQSVGLSSTTNALSRLLQLISGARGFTALFYRLDSWSCHFGRKVATNNLCSNVSIVIIIIFQVFPMCTANCFSSSFFLTCAKALLLEVEVVKDVATTLG